MAERAPAISADPAAFHLEIGGVYERFGDRESAIAHVLQAVGLAQDAVQRVLAYSALARLRDAGGDRAGAIDALEQALAILQDPERARSSQSPSSLLAGPAGDDVITRLARLYEESGAYERARALCERALSAGREPWQRERLQRLEIDVLRKAGTLQKEVAEKEKTLDAAVADESALRFLAIALGSDGMQGPGAVGGSPAGRAPSGKLVRVFQRLHQLHPEDRQIRQNLQALLEQAGKTEDAVKLVTAEVPASPMDCEQEFAQLPASGALGGAAAAVRIRLAAGQKAKALAETANIVTLSKREGIVAYLVAAQLYADQGDPGRASPLIERAAREARSREDQRRVAYARERHFDRAGRVADLNALHAQWNKADDPCLQLAATRRDRALELMAGVPATPRPDSPRPGLH